jgi:hypothetical protein
MPHIHPQPTISGVLVTPNQTSPVQLRVDIGDRGQIARSYISVNGVQSGPFKDSFTENLGTAKSLKGAQVIITTVVWDVDANHNRTTWDMKLTAGAANYDPPMTRFDVPAQFDGSLFQALVIIV